MVYLSVPTPVVDIPERVHGGGALFRVRWSDAHVSEHPGRIYSVRMLFDSLVARLSRDASIDKVEVILASGRLLCVCGHRS